MIAADWLWGDTSAEEKRLIRKLGRISMAAAKNQDASYLTWEYRFLHPRAFVGEIAIGYGADLWLDILLFQLLLQSTW